MALSKRVWINKCCWFGRGYQCQVYDLDFHILDRFYGWKLEQSIILVAIEFQMYKIIFMFDNFQLFILFSPALHPLYHSNTGL